MVNLVRRSLQTARAFVRMGFLLEISYPASFIIGQLQVLVPVLTYYFINHLVPEESANVAGDYFTFVVIGILTARTLNAALADLSQQLDEAIQQGRLEMLLVEPIRWRLLPFCLVVWPFTVRMVTTLMIGAVAIALGAGFRLAGLLGALVLVVVGTLATLVIGTVVMSVKVLAKRQDPVQALYLILVSLLSGAYFPVEVLPGPLEALSRALPLTYVLSGVRQLLMVDGSQLSGPSPMAAMVALTAFTVVAGGAALWLLGRTMEFARRIGVLGGY